MFPGEIGAGKEGALIMAKEDAEGPAPLSCHGGTGFHIQMVNIRSLFPIQLDCHKMPIEHIGNLLIKKALSVHYMTPVTRRLVEHAKSTQR